MLGGAFLVFPALASERADQVAGADCPAPPEPQDPRNQAYYDFVHTYRPACAATTNWDRKFTDVTVATAAPAAERVQVTTSTALGGAIASLRFAGREYIASGGHGAALQYNFHAWDAGRQPSECYNPTQAGSTTDDDSVGPPWHGPSTSALFEHAATGRQAVQARSRLAMFVPLTSPRKGYGDCQAQELQPNRSPYNQGLSPYLMTAGVQLAPANGHPRLTNVVRLSATLDSEDRRYPDFDGVLVAYLQRDFTQALTYQPATGKLLERAAQASSAEPAVRCTADRGHCLGMYFRPAALPGAYYYTMAREPNEYNGFFGEQNIQVTAPAKDIGRDGRTRLGYEVFLAVGDQHRVARALRDLVRRG